MRVIGNALRAEQEFSGVVGPFFFFVFFFFFFFFFFFVFFFFLFFCFFLSHYLARV